MDLALSRSVCVLESKSVKSMCVRWSQVSVLLALVSLALPIHADYSNHPEAKKFVADMVSKYHISQGQIFDGDQNPGLDMIGLRVNYRM